MRGRRAVVGQQLVVVVAGQRDVGDGRVGGNQALHDPVDVAATCGNRHRSLVADGRLKIEAGVEQIHIEIAVRLGGLELLGRDVDDATGGAAVVGRKVARVEFQTVDHAHRQDAANAAKAIDERHRCAVHEECRVLRRRSAHKDVARASGAARHSGEVLDDGQGVAHGSGHLVDDHVLDHGAADFFALALGGDHLVEGIV